MEERGVLFTGDAMVNFDYVTGTRGVAQHPFNEDRAQAARSLERLRDLSAEVVLFGHGDPWTEGPGRAVEIIRNQSAARFVRRS